MPCLVVWIAHLGMNLLALAFLASCMLAATLVVMLFLFEIWSLKLLAQLWIWYILNELIAIDLCIDLSLFKQLLALVNALVHTWEAFTSTPLHCIAYFQGESYSQGEHVFRRSLGLCMCQLKGFPHMVGTRLECTFIWERMHFVRGSCISGGVCMCFMLLRWLCWAFASFWRDQCLLA